MNPGTSEMHFVAALDRVPGMRAILCLFEGVCSGAADGYARMLRTPAATLLHLGPGLANGLSNFHNARKARSPIVSIVGEHSTQHLRYDAPLSADIPAFASGVSNDIHVVRRAEELGSAALTAIRAAVNPPGQVSMLIVPADISWSDAGEPAAAVPFPSRNQPDKTTIREAAEALRSRQSVGLLLGGTALTGPALAAAGRLASATGVRVFADRNAARMESGRGRFQPCRIPYFPEPARQALAGLQHIVLVEAKPPISFFGYPDCPSELLPDGCEIHHLAKIDEDGPGALAALVDECGAGHSRIECNAQGAVPLPPFGDLTPDTVGAVVSALLPEGAIVSEETVSASAAVWNHLLRSAPYDHLPVTGGSIGQGLPVALGAAVACPGRKVIALEADGSGMYTPQSLWSMARESADVTIVIFSNRRYRILDVEMRRTGAEAFGPTANNMIDIGRPDLDWMMLSQAMGVPAAKAATLEEFRRQFSLAMGERGPRLIEAVLAES
jgi:acetolactate synthase-1/2/3 large subunit